MLPTRGVAFVTYATESLAQFAKEAMSHQALDNSEILNVRWATQDPNPAAQKREARKIEEQAADAIRRALPEAFVREIEGRDPEAKRRRIEEGSFGLEGYQASDEVWFESEKARMKIENGAYNGLNEGMDGTLESPDQKPLLENLSQLVEPTAQDVGGGLLTASTLAAVEAYRGNGSGEDFVAPTSVAIPGGGLVGYAQGLVGYGSEDDSD